MFSDKMLFKKCFPIVFVNCQKMWARKIINDLNQRPNYYEKYNKQLF